jgi:hypothetical protein
MANLQDFGFLVDLSRGVSFLTAALLAFCSLRIRFSSTMIPVVLGGRELNTVTGRRSYSGQAPVIFLALPAKLWTASPKIGRKKTRTVGRGCRLLKSVFSTWVDVKHFLPHCQATAVLVA